MKKFYEPVLFANIVLEVCQSDFDSKLGASLSIKDTTDKKGHIFRTYKIQIENKKDFYALMHECLHLVVKIFEDRQIPFTADNEEMIAYYQMFWFKKLWRELNK